MDLLPVAQRARAMMALAVPPVAPAVDDAADSLNTAGLGVILWIAVLVVVFVAVLAVPLMGLLGSKRTRE